MTAVLMAGWAAGAFADSLSDDWKDARKGYERNMEKYQKELRKAAEERRDRDFDDYREHREKARRYLQKAEKYQREAERLERRMRKQQARRPSARHTPIEPRQHARESRDCFHGQDTRGRKRAPQTRGGNTRGCDICRDRQTPRRTRAHRNRGLGGLLSLIFNF